MSSGSSKSVKHSRTKGGIPVEEQSLIKGWIARESTIVEKLLNKRYAVLYSTVFATYRKETDESPSKTWAVTKDVLVSKVEGGEYHLRNSGTSTLWAVARGAYEKVNMWGFTVTWSSLMSSSSDKLSLAFDSKDLAESWHEAFSNAIQAASKKGSINGSGMTRSTESSTILHATESQGLEHVSTGASGGEGGTPRSWASLLHINGISVYVEELDEDGGGGAVMVSAVVRAPPSDVMHHLVRTRKKEGLAIFAGARTLKVVDENTHIIGQTWKGSGLIGRWTAPREMVLLRTWRKDTDGTYIVLYQSTNHMSMRRQVGSWWSWSTPVRVDVEAAGFTIAPLLPQYAVPGFESQESLVTLVLKADLGGMLSGGSAAGRLLSPILGNAVRSMLEPVVTSIVVLRDQVEQNRFVIRPLSHVLDMEPEAHEGEVSTSESRRLTKSTTMLAYKNKKTLAEEQIYASRYRKATDSLILDRKHLEEIEETREVKEVETKKKEPDDSWAIAGTCQKKFWCSPGNCNFKIRGKEYLVDKKKIPAAVPMFELVAVDLLEMEEPVYHVCQHLPSIKHSPAPFLFCVQMMVPSVPPVSLVCSWAAPIEMMGSTADQLIDMFIQEHGSCPPNAEAFFKCFTEFIAGDGPEADAKRNKKFKMIPNIAKGSWIIKQSVGTTPVILGQKLSTKYYRGDKYFEVDVDIGANSVAASITNLVCGATKSLAVDLGVLIEGQSEEHLPEQLIGTVRLEGLDLKTASYFDESSGTVMRKDDLHE